MDHIFRFRIPRRWKLHLRSRSPKGVGETPKKDTSPPSACDAPKQDTSPTNTPRFIGRKQKPPTIQADYYCDTRPGIEREDARIPKIQDDYFFGPCVDWSQDQEIEPDSKPDTTEGVTLPLEAFNSMKTQLFTAQLNRGKIQVLEEKLKKMARLLEDAQETINTRDHTVEVLAEMYKKERAKASKPQENTVKNCTSCDSRRLQESADDSVVLVLDTGRHQIDTLTTKVVMQSN